MSTDWVRDFFVPKEKPFGWCKVRHKIADCLESGYTLTYCQLVEACMREVALQTPRAELPGFYKGEEFLLGVGNAVGTVKCSHRFSIRKKNLTAKFIPSLFQYIFKSCNK